jgi:hypothetical protein
MIETSLIPMIPMIPSVPHTRHRAYTRMRARCVLSRGIGIIGIIGITGCRRMTAADLQQLRDLLVIRRAALIDRLATDGSGTIEAAFVALLADTHTAIAAVDAALAEAVAGDAP